MVSTWTLLCLVFQFASTIVATGTDEIPMEDTNAYTTAFQANPCCTSCAVIPSASFKSSYSCDPADPFTCICGNETLSVDLRSSIGSYCLAHCGPASVRYATSILADYCLSNSIRVGAATEATTTSSSTGTASQTASTSRPTSTSTSTSAPTNTPDSQDNHLSRGEIAGIIVGVVVGVISIAIMLIALINQWVPRARRRLTNRNSNGGGVQVILNQMFTAPGGNPIQPPLPNGTTTSESPSRLLGP